MRAAFCVLGGMPRRKRFIPPRSLVEVSAKTIQARYLLRPSRELNRRFIGILARARALYDVQVHVVSCLSNHWHALVSPRDALSLARFMNFVQGNLAKEAGDLHDWRGPFWGDRYHAVLVSEEPEIQHRRLAYCLAQGAKEGLVARPEMWPGVHSVHALRDGEPLRGVWYDRTGHTLASRSGGQSPSLEDFASEETLELDPLPAWADEGLDPTDIRSRIARMLEDVASEVAEEHRRKGTRPSAPAVFLRVHPHQKPAATKRAPMPLVHAASRAVRRRFREAYALFVEVYLEAARRLREGDERPGFPPGSFPPGLPFVPVPEPG